MVYLLIIGVAYLVGAIPTAWLIGCDPVFTPRNPSFHSFLRREVVWTVAIDMGKGIAATIFGLLCGGWLGACLAAITVVVGSVYSLFNWDEGSGVAVAAGALLVLSPVIILAGIMIYLLALLLTRYVFVSTWVAVVGVVLLSFFLVTPVMVIIVILALALLVLFNCPPNWQLFSRGWGQGRVFGKGKAFGENKAHDDADEINQGGDFQISGFRVGGFAKNWRLGSVKFRTGKSGVGLTKVWEMFSRGRFRSGWKRSFRLPTFSWKKKKPF